MRFTAAVAVVLISGGMALAQKLKDPVVHVRPTPRLSAHSTVAPPITSSSASLAAELARIEQQTARLGSNKPVAHPPSSIVKETPALDLGKNKPVLAGRPPQRANPNGH